MLIVDHSIVSNFVTELIIALISMLLHPFPLHLHLLLHPHHHILHSVTLAFALGPLLDERSSALLILRFEDPNHRNQYCQDLFLSHPHFLLLLNHYLIVHIKNLNSE